MMYAITYFQMTQEKEIIEASLVIQWWRLHTANAGAQGSIPGRRTRSYMLQLKRPHVTTKIKDPVCCS